MKHVIMFLIKTLENVKYELDAGHLKMDKCELNCLPMQSVH